MEIEQPPIQFIIGKKIYFDARILLVLFKPYIMRYFDFLLSGGDIIIVTMVFNGGIIINIIN